MSGPKKKISPPDQAQRDQIVNELKRSMLVEAAAGTGKTTCLIERMIAMAEAGGETIMGAMSAVTFTRKAAAELRGRFRIRLEEKTAKAEGSARARLDAALGNIDKLFIGTIHSFCARILRERPVESGLGFGFKELEPAGDEQLQHEAWDRMVSGLVLSDPEGLLDALDKQGLEIGRLKDAFFKAAVYPDVDLETGASPRALPDMAKAARQIEAYVERMMEIDRDLPENHGTDELIPAYRAANRMLGNTSDLAEVAAIKPVLDELNKKRKVTQYVWAETGKYSKQDAKDEMERYVDFQEKVVRPALNAIYESRYPLVLKVIKQAQKVYDDLRRERRVLNFQDLLMKTAELLRGDDEVRAYFQNKYRYLLIDEFQDTDPIQAEVMLLLAAKDPKQRNWRECLPRPGALFVVGDPKQSIYRFRRADLTTYNDVRAIIQKGGGLFPQLNANFRATAAIIEGVNEIFSPGPQAEDPGEPLLRFPEKPTAESPSYVPLVAGNPDMAPGELSGLYRLTIPEDVSTNDGCAAFDSDVIARFIRNMVDNKVPVKNGKPARYSDFMIVNRNTKHLAVYSRALGGRGIPHQVTGGSAMNEVAELKLLAGVLAAASDPDDPVKLVGALRGELMGISDRALYAFKKAGGKFDYRADPPAGLPADLAASFPDCFSRMRNYAEWLGRLPFAAAVEKIAIDLGAQVMAACGDGGNLQAGSVGKAIEVLRARSAGNFSAADTAELLNQLAAAEEKFDGVPARPLDDNQVRVMNLHKVKGLEAPVVFLAGPFGENDFGFDIHVERGKDGVNGWIALADEDKKPLAKPPEWDNFHEPAERKFQRAEELRLRYVAATRAGAALVVSQRTKGNSNNKNPWQYFEPFLEKDLEDPGKPKERRRKPAAISPQDAARAEADIARKIEKARAPSYESMSTRELAGIAIEDERKVGAARILGEHGVEWGAVIHILLETAMKDPKADLTGAARSALIEREMDPALAEKAVEMARGVMDSKLWGRAAGAGKYFAEVPFQALMEKDGLPAVIRGVIDLAFREKDGWVIVDYKTDSVGKKVPAAVVERYAPQVRAYAEAWSRITGEPVKEKLLFFTRPGIEAAVE